MLCDPSEAAFYLNYQSPASLYRLISAGLLDDHIEMHEGQVLLRMGSKGKSPTLAKRVRSLVNFRGGHEMFMFDPKEEESLQRIRDRHYEKALKIFLSNDNHFRKLSIKRSFITAIIDFI
tara:strand:+ start:182 stop:541 length:360 start_codon:yes stop_codon:yes gene_type:complete